jgi:hypothetical protein
VSGNVGAGSREDNASNKKPARRPARRSIVDLTEAARRAADGGVLSAPTAAAPNDPPRRRRAASPAAFSGSEQDQAAVKSIASEAPAVRGEGEKHAEASGTCELNASDSSADMAVKIAKAYQAETLDDIKAGFNAALDYAAEFARRGASSEAATDPIPEDSGAERRNALTAQYRAEAAELMKANMATTMDFARRLLSAKSPAEWVELTSTQARLQCELMLQQTRALRSFARTVTKSDRE